MARRWQELPEYQIQQQFETDNDGKIFAIYIETGAFWLAHNVLPATN